MFWRKRGGLLVTLTLILMLGAAAAAPPRKMQRLSAGTWGGPHIRIEVESDSATIDYDCATGTINGPLQLDSQGGFTWRGRHKREHGGPIREDEVSNDEPATYSGSVKGDILTLSVKLADNQEWDSFTLKRGSAGRVFKCK